MSSNLDDLLAGLPTADDVSRWEDLSRRLGVEIAELSEKKRRVDQLVEGAKRIFNGAHEGAISRTATVDLPVVEVGKSPPARRVSKGTWTTAILEIAQQSPDGIPYDELRERLPEGLREQVRLGNTKAFYGSMRRLEEDGLVARFNSHLFTAEGFERFKATPSYHSLARKGSAKRGSPISDAVKSYLSENGPSKALAIKEFLCRTPEFRDPLKRNSSALYNILKRLVDRDELLHDKEKAVFALPNENKTPDCSFPGALPSGEAPTSPIDAPLLGRVAE